MGAGLWDSMIPTGNAKRETGEDISYKEVDMEKLRLASKPAGGDISWDIKDENDPIKVHDGKSGPRLWGLPTTEHVRSSLLPSQVQVSAPVDFNAGFSGAFLDGTKEPTSSFVDNFSTIRPENTGTEASAPEILGGIRASSVDSESEAGQKSKVGQI